jgi:hypothetical protein
MGQKRAEVPRISDAGATGVLAALGANPSKSIHPVT